jgi:hypothetical protein
MNPIVVRAINIGRRVHTVITLFGRGADIDRLTITLASLKLEIVDAATNEARVDYLVVLREIAQPQTLAAAVLEGHMQDAQASHAVVRLSSHDVEQLLTVATPAGGRAPQTVDCAALECQVVVMDLDDAAGAAALYSRVGRPCDRDRRTDRPVAFGDDILVVGCQGSQDREP